MQIHHQNVSEEARDKLLKLNRCVRWIVYIYLITFAGIYFLFELSFWKVDLNIDKYLAVEEYMIMNYNSDLIIQIRPQETCSDSYQTVEFKEWPGTYDGCICNKRISKGMCDHL